jgi:uncharacterized SAM-binding protein YcdF (DUF218 family)
MFRFLRYMLTLLILILGIPFALWVAGFIIFTGSICSMNEPQIPFKADAAIVLTGGTNRVGKGLDLLSQNRTQNLLVSGVHKDVEVKDIVALWNNHTQPTPTCCITLGREAGNTIGNAQEAKKWIDHIQAKTVFLITANYHMPRALVEFHHELPHITVIPYPVKPEGFDPKQKIFWTTDFLEYHKLLMTILRVTAFPNETKPLPDALTK